MGFGKFSAIAIALVSFTCTPEAKAEESNDVSKWYVTGSVGLSNPSGVESEEMILLSTAIREH